MPNGETVRELVGGLGMLVLVVKVSTILVPLLWGDRAMWDPIEVTCLVVEIASIAAARYLRDPTEKGSGKYGPCRLGAFGL